MRGVSHDDDDDVDLSNVKVDDRFYTPKEYNDLSSDQKHKLKLLREKRGGKSKGNKRKGKGSGKGNNEKGQYKKKFKKMQKENKTMQQRIAALETQLNSNEDTSSSEDDSDGDTNTQKSKKVRFNQRSD